MVEKDLRTGVDLDRFPSAIWLAPREAGGYVNDVVPRPVASCAIGGLLRRNSEANGMKRAPGTVPAMI